jgi:hypothetical protein
MALPTSYLTTSKNLQAILASIQNAQAPETFTVNFLNSLDFKSSSDRLIIGVLKSLGFLDPSGKPTTRYFEYLDQTRAPIVLAEGIRAAYSDLFQVNKKANEMTRAELTNKLKTLSQGQLAESVLDKMVMTFQALVAQANFEETAKVTQDTERAPAADVNQKEPDKSGSAARSTDGLSLGGLVYNIQIVLPDTRDQAVYEALFRALRSHLL